MTFRLDPGEREKIDLWLFEHNKTCVYYDDGTEPVCKAGAIGGNITYSFTPTSLGVIVRVSCACGEHTDVTDYKSW